MTIAAVTVPWTRPAIRASSATMSPAMIPLPPWQSWPQRTSPSIRPSTWTCALVARSPLITTSGPMKDKAGGPARPALGAAAVAVGLRENIYRRLPRAGRDYRSGRDSDQAPAGLKSGLRFLLFALFIFGWADVLRYAASTSSAATQDER